MDGFSWRVPTTRKDTILQSRQPMSDTGMCISCNAEDVELNSANELCADCDTAANKKGVDADAVGDEAIATEEEW